MNDRLKFRLVVKQGVEWRIYDVLNILFKQDGTIWVQTIRESESATFTAWWLVDGVNAILDQCTGLKDRSGNLIYDRDVLRDKFRPYDLYVAWDNFRCCFVLKRFDIEGWQIRLDSDMRAKFEIIGNVHEMKEENEETAIFQTEEKSEVE